MKKMLKITVTLLATIGFFWGVIKTIEIGLDKEFERQCVVAKDMCEKYPDSCKDVEKFCEQ